jgi:LacI family transcriptional regulator
MGDKVNLLSLAEKTGYSVSTVSRVLSGKAEKYRISRSAVDLIKEEARRSNYSPNLVAQSLRTRKSQTIGLVVPGIDNPFFATLASIVINLLAGRGYHTLLADSRENADEEAAALDMFRRRSVDGIIAVPVASSPQLHEEISRTVPLVLIDRYFKSTVLPYVCTDNYAGAVMATKYLLDKGYRRILAVQGVPASMPNQERVRGFRAALEGHAAESRIVGDAFSVDNGYRRILEEFSGPGVSYDAVFAFSTTILLGVIDALRELGYGIARDVGVISFDNNGFLDFLDPAVTRVEQPLREAGELAVRTLFSLIESRAAGLPEPPPVQKLIPPTLIVRSSC